MRRKLSLAAVSVAVALGVGVGAASPASAAVFGTYATKADCDAAKGQRSDRYCDLTQNENGSGVWVLTDHLGGG